MRVFLSGPMGSGKSDAAPRVARRLGTAAFDLDTAIEQETGSRVSEIFRCDGEARFRELEAATLGRLIESSPDCVIALGGGTVTRAFLRRELLAAGTLVTLDASIAELAARVGRGESRPLLSGRDVASELGAIGEARADAYSECHARIDTTALEPEAVADAVVRVVRDPPIVVPLGRRSYRVEIGSGIRVRLPERVPRQGVVVLVTDHAVGKAWGGELRRVLDRGPDELVEVSLEPGERSKNLESVARIWDAALDAGVDRGSFLLGLGGGVVGDLGGFAASTLLRGIALGHVPTTLLAMVDSAIGGKTGFDTVHGKNLIGTFHQPTFVLCDLELLASLPEPERRAGLAEVVKSAWIAGEGAVAELERDAEALVAADPGATERAVRMAASLKARVVGGDEREAGERAVLNLGHTVGHALEAAGGYASLRHGEAVALGLVAAARVARGLGRADRGSEARLIGLLARLGLPTDLDGHLSPKVLGHVKFDKKRRAGEVGFVVPGAPGSIERLPLALDRLAALLRPPG